MADQKISALSDASALTGAELLLLSQGAADRKQTLSQARSDLEWIKPSDWPAMPAAAANTIRILAAIFDTPSNYLALRISVSSGTWSIDWGDGSSPTTGIASNTTAEKNIDYAASGLSAVTSRGYKVALITITTSGGDIKVFNPSIVPTGATQAPSPYLEMQIHASACTTYSFQNNSQARSCEYINFVASGQPTSFNGMFANFQALQKLSYPSNFLSAATHFGSAFSDCNSLKSIDLTGFPTSGVTATTSMFSGCASLKRVTFPAGSLGSGLTDVGSMFNSCTLLEEVNFPSGAFSAVSSTGGQSMFTTCVNLRKVVFPSGAFASVTNFSGLFQNCSNLRYVEFGSALTAATNISNMFNSCRQLMHIKFASGGFASVTTTTNFLNQCVNLAKLENCSIPVSWTLIGRFVAAQLDAIYTALPTITSQTITVSGAGPGISGDDPTIATAKGWTVTGS